MTPVRVLQTQKIDPISMLPSSELVRIFVTVILTEVTLLWGQNFQEKSFSSLKMAPPDVLATSGKFTTGRLFIFY
jgi:hypothetical protein